MKNRSRISIFLICVVTMVFMVGLAGCSDMFKKGKGYTITYIEGETAKTIAVEKGGSFALSPVPTKEGYTFQGLFDSADKQYINKDGLGLFAYDLDSDLTLSIKWAPIECQLILDYRGGKVEGARSIKILYGENVTALPTTTKENYVFTGWFTQPNGKGVQIADEFGILPLKEVFTSATYEIANGVSTIYAGFDIIKHSVKFYFGTDAAAESQVVQSEHGSKLVDIAPEKLVNGLAVLTWSTVKDGTAIFNGEILADMTLYAVEFAPQISFNCSGGAALKAIVAKEGSPIVLPNAVRENYVFSNWLDEKGVAQDFATMPSKSMTLTANWKPMVIFDENGGSSVKDLTLNKGDAITLPSPTKSDMIFDAWYTENDVKFVGANIGKESVKLKAKYFKIVKKNIIMATKPWCPTQGGSVLSNIQDANFQKINLADELGLASIDANNMAKMKIKYNLYIRETTGYGYRDGGKQLINFYSNAQAVDKFYLGKMEFDHGGVELDASFKKYSAEVEFDIGKLAGQTEIFIRYYNGHSKGDGWYINNADIEVEYPDLSQSF